jgi:SAM-dependent methyltransferase
LSGTFFRSVIRANKRVSKSVARMWPHASFDIFDAYDRCVAAYAARHPEIHNVADVGAGNRCPFRKYMAPEQQVRIIGVDISQEAMKDNVDLDEKRVANVVEGLPFHDAEVDLLVSRSVLEHLPDVETFVAHSARVLRPGGYSIHVFPGRYAHFALINRLIPNAWTRRLMGYLYPKNVSGFPAFYDRCYFTGLREALAENGFEVVEERVSYYASDYYTFFFPLFLISILYEMSIKSLRLKNLGATQMIVARRRA